MDSDVWIIIDPPGASVPSFLASGINGSYGHDVLDVTHVYSMIRIYGSDSAKVTTKLCAIDFSDEILPSGSALRTSVAGLVSLVIRADCVGNIEALRGSTARSRSYVMLCERSAGKYLFDSLLDAGQEFEIDIEGFARLLPE